MNPCVLVVDDNPDVRTILTIQLRRAGFDVITAPDGRAGLDALTQHTPCCVLLDLVMPGMDGFGFLAALDRVQPEPPPVFVVTQNDDGPTRERVRQLGAARLIPKIQALSKDFAAALEDLFTPTGPTEDLAPPTPLTATASSTAC